MSLFHSPYIQQFSKLEFFAKQVVEGFITGLHKSPFHGFSVEFAEHRLYNKGESTRHIDWKLFARSEKLFVKRYEEETNLRCQIVIDTSSSMNFPFEINSKKETQENKIEFSVKSAACLIELFKKQRDAVGLTLFNQEIQKHFNARSGNVHLKLIYSELEKLISDFNSEQLKTSNISNALHQIAETIHKRSLVIIFSDMFENAADNDSLFSALQHLKHKKHEVILFHVTDKEKEFDFNFENRPYKFIDLESGEEIKLNSAEVKQHYIESITKVYEEIKLKCAQYKIDFIEADIKMGFHQVLKSYLIKRNLLA
jgi:uncharacterized protein (DUF58 family)